MNHTPQSWARIQGVFQQALEMDSNARNDFIAIQLQDRPDLCFEVETLLDSYDSSESLEIAAVPGSPGLDGGELDFGPIEGYELGEEIHRGAQGIVYRAVQLSTQRDVAIKFLIDGSQSDEMRRKRFVREVRVISGLSHPGIVTVFDSGVTRGQHYYVMPLVQGVRFDVYSRQHADDTEHLLGVFCKLCDAVGYGHQHSIVHRDLKPANILVDATGQPRVLDFGLAKLGELEAPEQTKLSLTGQIMGTLGYMSPEQTLGDSSVIETPSDVYSLGVLLYEILAGTAPYRLNESLLGNLQKIQAATPETRPLKVRRVDSGLQAIIFKALSKEPGRRYPTAAEFASELRRYQAGEVITAKRGSTFYVIRKRLTQHSVWFGMVVVLLAGIVIGSYWIPSEQTVSPIASPLSPLAPGELYSEVDLENQMDAIRDMIRFRHDCDRIVASTIKRFQNLAPSQFDPDMESMRFADLELMQSLASFLASKPDWAQTVDYREAFESYQQKQDVPISGLASEIAQAVLECAIQHQSGTVLDQDPEPVSTDGEETDSSPSQDPQDEHGI